MTACGMVLAGGQSTRMGTAKTELPWAGATLLQRTVDTLAAGCADVVVVAAPGQRVTVRGAAVVHDAVGGRGPLQGLHAGLAAAGQRGADTAFVCATDLPLLVPAFVRAVLDARGPETDVALPVVRGREQPLAAAYATSLAPVVERLLGDGEQRLRAVLDHAQVRRLPETALLAVPALAAADPGLESVINVNTPAELAWARARAGQPSP